MAKPNLVGSSFILAISISFGVIALLVIYQFVQGNISPRVLGIVFLTLMVGVAGATWVKLKKAGTATDSTLRNLPDKPTQIDASIRTLRSAVVALLISLVTGLWLSRGGPLIPRLIGAAINLFLTGLLVLALRRAKRLQESEDQKSD